MNVADAEFYFQILRKHFKGLKQECNREYLTQYELLVLYHAENRLKKMLPLLCELIALIERYGYALHGEAVKCSYNLQ